MLLNYLLIFAVKLSFLFWLSTFTLYLITCVLYMLKSVMNQACVMFCSIFKMYRVSQNHPGDILGHPEVILGHTWFILDHPGVILGHPGVILESSWIILGHLGVIIESSLESSWSHPGSSWRYPGLLSQSESAKIQPRVNQESAKSLPRNPKELPKEPQRTPEIIAFGAKALVVLVFLKASLMLYFVFRH